jgi:hypothetical protein
MNPDNSSVTVDSGQLIIRSTITVTEPTGVGTESWGLQTTQDITFTKKGAINTVNIYYAPDGSTYEASPINAAPIDISALADDTPFTWQWENIPVATPLTTAGYNGKVEVRVEDPTEQKTHNAKGESNGGFQLRGSITNVTPSGDTTGLIVGQPYNIEWQPVGSITKYKIEYSKNNFAGGDDNEISLVGGEIYPGPNITEPVAGTLRWVWSSVDDDISNSVKFRVSDYNSPEAKAVSGANNYIRGTLDLTKPDASTVYSVGDTIEVEWTQQGNIGNKKIEYTPDHSLGGSATWYPIDSDYIANGDGTKTLSPVWFAPNKISGATGDYKVRISNVSPPAGTELTDESAAKFSVRPTINTVSPPTDIDVWEVGTTQTITWSATTGLKADGSTRPKVKLDYIVDGQAPQPLATGVDSHLVSNDYEWFPVPTSVNSEDVVINVAYEDYTSINKDSASFSIRPTITLDGTITINTKLYAFSNNPALVKWTYTGDAAAIGNLRVRYDLNNDGTFTGDLGAENVAPGAGVAGIDWNSIPDVNANVKIRVYSISNPLVRADTPNFAIVGGISNIAPAGGVNKPADTTMDVTWNYTGNITNFAISYSATGGAPYTQIGTATAVADCVGGVCTFNWLDTEPNNDDLVHNLGRIKIDNARLITDPIYTEAEAATTFKRGAVVSALTADNGPYIDVGSMATNITWSRDKGLAPGTLMEVEYTNNYSEIPANQDWYGSRLKSRCLLKDYADEPG